MAQSHCASYLQEKIKMSIVPPSKIKIIEIHGKGRGVVATKKINTGEVIEVCPLLVLSDVDATHTTTQSDHLKFYALELTKMNKQVLHLGYGMIYNHSFEPNAEIEYEPSDNFIIFRALTDIEPEEEITYNYDFVDNMVEFLPMV
jgi:hypothetical protein